jgi:hypothetical protein
MHTSPLVNRLRVNRRAYDHFQKFQGTYLRYARTVRDMLKEYPLMTMEGRVFCVKRMILDLDPNIWGLSNVNNIMTADEIADAFARLVVGHEDGDSK